MFLCEDTPTVKYFRVELVETADAAEIIESIETVFNQFGITSFTDRMSGLNVDGASGNVGVHRGVGSWYSVVSPVAPSHSLFQTQS